MFNFFKKAAKPITADLSFIGVDMHSHLLPGIDDGLKEVEQSVEFIKQLQLLGYRKLICTPHIFSDLYPNTPQTIFPKLDLVRNALIKEGIKMEIEAAAEYMIDHDFGQLLAVSKKEHLLTIAGKYILVEMSYLSPSPNVEQTIFDLRMLGLIPILAHPERYNYYHGKFEQYERFKELGCLLQVNLLSLSGGYGPSVQKAAEKMFKTGLVDLLGTDMHHERHLAMLQKLAKKKEFYDIVTGATLLNDTL